MPKIIKLYLLELENNKNENYYYLLLFINRIVN